MAVPGICLCYAPGISHNDSVAYSLYDNGFTLGSNHRGEGIFVDRHDHWIGGGRRSSGNVNSPVARIDFFLASAWGEFNASHVQTQRITGHMANSNYTGGLLNGHRQGNGGYFLANQDSVERIGRAIRLPVKLPKMANVENADKFFEVIDGIRGSNSNAQAWFTHLRTVMLGTANLAVIAWLKFP